MSELMAFFDRWEERRSHKALFMPELFHSPAEEQFGAAAQDRFVNAVLQDMRKIVAEAEIRREEAGGTFEMANVQPDRPGLPFNVFISERGQERHDVRVKVSRGPKVRGFVATVSVRPEVEVLAGDLSGPDLALLSQWIEL